MAHADHTVWVHPEAAPGAVGGCGACAPTQGAPACTAGPGIRCEHPALVGDASRLAVALQALRQVGDADGNLVDTQRFSALRVSADEVELTLGFPRSCGPSRLLAEDAFQVLRRALPDTDVYVLHAA